METVRHVARPPSKPLMVFDGDCAFCRRWIDRWRRRTGEAVDYIPSQDERVSHWFPEIALNHFSEAVHLIARDGTVYRGAEAVLQSLNSAGRGACLLRWYRSMPWFARVLEAGYRWVARNRTFLSRYF